MQTLSEPLFELNQESEHYKVIREIKDSQPRINEIIREIADLFNFNSKEFVYYGSRGFGFHGNTEAYEKFSGQLTKNPDRNGVYTFKKATKEYKTISPKMLEISNIQSKVSPFALHDIFGMNNLKASQWIGDRYFVEVKSKLATYDLLKSERRIKQFRIEPVKEIKYKEYLSLVLEKVDD